MKIDRLVEILMLLINKEKVTASELADYFKVSIRTIRRDIDTLSVAGIPIYSTVGKSGGYQLLNNYKLDKSFLDKQEATTLIGFLQGLAKSVPNSKMKSAFNKLSMLFPNKETENKIVIKLNPHVNEQEFSKQMKMLTEAIDNQLKIKITYIDASFKETSRTIAPYTLVMMGSTWYVYGYCYLRESFRAFKISRIIDCILLTDEFNKSNLPMQLPEDLPWNNNMDSRRENTNITLELDKAMLGRIPDYFSYNDCKVEQDKIIVKTAYPVDEWLYSLFTSLIPYIKILEPEWVRAEFTSRLKDSLEKNKL